MTAGILKTSLRNSLKIKKEVIQKHIDAIESAVFSYEKDCQTSPEDFSGKMGAAVISEFPE